MSQLLNTRPQLGSFVVLCAFLLSACGGSPAVKTEAVNANFDALNPSRAEPVVPKVQRQAAELFSEGVAHFKVKKFDEA
jgi:hypothetical protein